MKKMLSLLLICAMILSAGLSGASAEDTETGTDADALRKLGNQYYEEQDFAKALSLYEQAAALGDAKAMYNIARLYVTGEGVEVNYETAAAWFLKSAQAGETAAMFTVGIMYAGGTGFAQDGAAAVEWLQKAADAGKTEAMYYLGLIYVGGEGVPTDCALAMEWFQKAAAAGHVGALYDIGLMYYNGEGVEQDYLQAAQWFLKAAEKGNTDAMNLLSQMYMSGLGVEQDISEGVAWLDRANGREPDPNRVVIVDGKIVSPSDGTADKMAQEWYEKGMALVAGEDESLWDVPGAIAYFEMAAAQGHTQAMRKLGWIYLYAVEVENIDKKKAAEWFREAAKAGDVTAMIELADMYDDRDSVIDPEEALRWYMKAAEAGNQAALYQLGRMYFQGEYVEKDHSRALEYLLKCADYENGYPMTMIGEIYHEGSGVPRDDALALKWLQRAAKRDWNAWYYLALMYIQGDGVPQDIEKGVEMLLQAGERGRSWGLICLGIVYLGEHGAERDIEMSRAFMRGANLKWSGLLGNTDMESVLSKAEAGDVFYMYVAGVRYLYGVENGIQCGADPEQAVRWLERSVEKVQWFAAITLAYEYYLGDVIPRDLERARQLMTLYQGADPGFAMLLENIEHALTEETPPAAEDETAAVSA